ncbi:MAG TPA: 16S rRNA (guanine(527)-N(7))-methyltransferase RsmG [Pyrinomonadaceae bacterium]|jgi:16S rRNA (guanine527-N7)-methyltransferase
MREEFIQSIKKHQSAFDLDLEDEKTNLLADYYELVQQNNEFLHLVAPTSAEEFAIRHILESLTLLEHLPRKTKFADVGTGAGLPSIPCLIVRDDLSGVLIESKAKKVKFLEETSEELNISERVRVINKQFEEAEKGGISVVTCRALDKFTQKLPRLLKWSGKAKLLFFGGESLAEALRKQKVRFQQKKMPMSEQRYLFVSQNV